MLGDPCSLPVQFNGLSFAACTQQLSDLYGTGLFVRPLQLRCSRRADLQPLQHLSSHYIRCHGHVRALRT